MEDREYVDAETGEVAAPVSERAIAARNMIIPAPSARFNAAIMTAVKKLPSWVTTDKDNEAFKRGGKPLKYASLKTIIETVRPILHEHGIRIKQGSGWSKILDEGGGSKGRMVPVFTTLIHAESGESETTEIEIPLTRMDAQAMGSAITYGRRYSLLAALGLATDEADDDGEAAKPRDVTQGVEESPALLMLKKEIDGKKAVTDLYAWGEEVKAKRRAEKLSESEHAILGSHYKARLHALMSVPDDEVKSAKKGKAE